MKKLKDLDLIDGENIVIDSLIKSITLYNDHHNFFLSAQLRLNPQTRKFKGDILFNFFNIKIFYWYNKDDLSLGYVERYKLIKLNNWVYLSLDPFDEHSMIPCEKDNNVIWAEKVERIIYEL